MANRIEHSGSTPEEDFESRLYGEGFPAGLPVFEVEVEPHLRNRKKINSPSQLQILQELVHFKASHGRWRIAKDLVGLVRRGHGEERDESYSDKLRRETPQGQVRIVELRTRQLRRASGRDVLNELGLLRRVARRGVGRDLPGGGRPRDREEASVHQRLRVERRSPARELRRAHPDDAHGRGDSQLQGQVEQPQIAVLLGNVWGGVSASAVPNADLILATSGTNFGFAGPNVIEAFEGITVPVDSQSAEANLLDRNIDVVLSDVTNSVGTSARSSTSTSCPTSTTRSTGRPSR